MLQVNEYLLIFHQESAYDLHGRMGEELPDDRWRPNIVVEGAEAWSEDLWESFAVTSSQAGTRVEMISVRPCDRCKVDLIPDYHLRSISQAFVSFLHSLHG